MASPGSATQGQWLATLLRCGAADPGRGDHDGVEPDIHVVAGGLVLLPAQVQRLEDGWRQPLAVEWRLRVATTLAALEHMQVCQLSTIEPVLQLIIGLREVPLEAGSALHGHATRGMLIAVATHGRIAVWGGLVVGHQSRAALSLASEAVDGVVVVGRCAAFTLEERPVQ